MELCAAPLVDTVRDPVRLFSPRLDGGWNGPSFLLDTSGSSRIVHLPDGQVFINGTHGADRVYATRTSAGRLSVYFVGKETREFHFASVSLIHFKGRNGDDFFDNQTTLPTLAFGDDGADTLAGGFAPDRIYGYAGNDQLYGRNGHDLVYGEDGDDLIFAGSDNDIVVGGTGNDRMYGEAGTDRLFGNDGEDVLAGGSGLDFLYGESGIDVLVGGPAPFEGDRLDGGVSADHILLRAGEVVLNPQSQDLELRFTNHTSSWTEAEMLVVDRGIRKLHDATRNNRLVSDYLTGDTLELVKYASLPGGAAAINRLVESSRDGVVISRKREIQFSEWNEANESLNGQRVTAFIHEVAHNFDSAEEMQANPWLNPSDFNQFLSISSWLSSNPNHSSYVRSGDGQWWYVRWAQFYRSYSTINPYEDWATVWELAFDETAVPPASGSNLGMKLSSVRSLIQRMRT